MSDFERTRRSMLERRLAALLEEYEAANSQLVRSLDDVSRLRLQRQVEDLEEQIQEIEGRIQGAAGEPERPTRAIPDGRNTKLDFKRGLERLGASLQGSDPAMQAEFHTLEERWFNNERAERVFGSSENTRNERSQVVYALNELALQHLGISFNELASE